MTINASDSFHLEFQTKERIYLKHIEDSLHELIEKISIDNPLAASIQYALFPGGKRIRPLCSLFLCEDLSVPVQDLITPSTSLELLHTASLVHDDLPALDNDDYRRGRPSLHKAFDEATAILTGDFLVPLAFQVIEAAKLEAESKLAFLNVLSKAYTKVCMGQMLDICTTDKSGEIIKETLPSLKTGALFEAGALFAGIFCRVGEEDLNLLAKFGNEVGVYFQLVNDFFDIYGDNKNRGYKGSSDIKNNRENTFSSKSLEEAQEVLKLAYNKIILGFAVLEERRLANRGFNFFRRMCEKIHLGTGA